MQHRNKLVGNYLSVVNKLLTLFVDKARYESAFNELPVEDTFEDVELFTNCLDLFKYAFGAYFDPELRIRGGSRRHLRKTMELIAEIFYNFSEGVDLSKSKQREKKLKRLLDRIYISHYQSISQRAAVLALYSLFVATAKGSAGEFVINYLLSKFEFQYDIFDSELSLVPINDRCILDNLLRYNLYRSDTVVRNTLVYFLQSITKLLQYSATNSLYRLFDGYLREQLPDIKNVLQENGDPIQWKIKLEKLLMLL
jgi:hypothetical protein